MAAEREREMQRARRNDGKPHPTEVLRAEARNALHLIGLGGDGVTHEDEMNARRGRGAGRARYTHILIKKYHVHIVGFILWAQYFCIHEP